MHEIRNQVELVAFYRFAVESPDVWATLEQQRLEHSRLGSGTLERFVPSADPKSEAVIEVRFDTPAGSAAGAEPRRLAARVVFNNNLLESITVPPSLVKRFRTFAIQGNWKKDWRRFEEVLKEHRVEHLYHFTDTRNLDSIREHGGLYSWWRCEQRGIRVPAPGSDRSSRERDRRRGLQNYVRLSFNKYPPMLHVARRDGRIERYVALKVVPSVAYLRPTLFSDVNANDGGARVGGDFESFARIRLDVATRRWDGEAEKRFFQAEVLVEGHIPLDLIKNL